MEAYEDNQFITADLNKVLGKWKSEIESLYNFQPGPG